MHLRADYGPLSIPNVTAEILFVKTGLILALFLFIGELLFNVHHPTLFLLIC